MLDAKAPLFVAGAALLLVVAFVGGFSGIVGGLAIHVAENGPEIPPDLETVYRQVGLQYGVPWAALAAWDGAESRFVLPIQPVETIFSNLVWEELEYRREQARRWCTEHPDDTFRCPPEEPELTPDEEVALWGTAYRIWRGRTWRHVEVHAQILQLRLGQFTQNPEAVYGEYMPSAQAIDASDLFEGYQILHELQADFDTALIVPVEPPEGWIPSNGFAWPVRAPLSSRFGPRYSPIDGQLRTHAGIDLAVSTGTPIRASKAGTVTVAGWSDVYGWMVVLNHGDGYSTLYAHASSLSVRVGQAVPQGQVVSLAGSTGYSTGPHLHFEIHYNGVPVDPLLLLDRHLER